MKLLTYLLILSVIISSCKKEEKEPTVNLPKDYGQGMYILTDQGVSFYNYLAVDSLRVVTENIYKKVNNTDIIQPKSIHISGKHAYIIGDKLYIANMETFGNEGIVDGFLNPVSCKKVNKDRLYVVDKGDATVKIVDLNEKELVGHIETGEGTQPINIVNNWFRAIVMNGGGVTKEERDSSIISIDYFTKYDGIAINDLTGKLNLAYNPNSAVFGTGVLWILCKGIYDNNNPTDNTESVIYQVWPYLVPFNDHAANFNRSLSGIYDADNLAINKSKNRLFFTAENGVYRADLGINPSLILNIDANCIVLNTERINDSTWVEYLYTNDANQGGKVLKYEAWTGFPVDTITVNGNILDVVFY